MLVVAGFHPRVAGQEASDSLAELEAAIQAELDEAGRGAVGVALVSRERNLWVAGFGSADPESGRLATADSYWRAGSISKSFVGLSALILAERNQLQLHDSVSDLAPEVQVRNRWSDTDPVRLGHLIEHTAGFDDLRPKDFASNDPAPLTLFQALAQTRESLSSRWPPGIHYSYSNAGPALAAYIVQKVDGRAFEDFVEEEIFQPLEMTGASLLLTDEIQDGLVAGFDGSDEPVGYRHLVVRPSGAVSVTPRQVANFVRMLLNRGELDGRRIVMPSSIERMERAETTLSAGLLEEFSYGLGNSATRSGGLVFRGHNGGMPGYRADYGYLPRAGLGYCIFVSDSTGRLYRRVRDLVRKYVVRDVEPPAKLPIARMPADIDQWTGHYRPFTPRLDRSRLAERLEGTAKLLRDRDRLTVRRAERDTHFYPVGDRVFRRKLASVATLALVEDRDGERYLQGEFGNFVKANSVAVWVEDALVFLVGLLLISSLVWGVALIPLRWTGRLSLGSVRVSICPVLACLSLRGAYAAAVIIAAASDNVRLADRYGSGPSLPGMAYAAFSWAFVGLALAGAVYTLKTGREQAGRIVYCYSVALSTACLALSAYLIYFGAIGFLYWH